MGEDWRGGARRGEPLRRDRNWRLLHGQNIEADQDAQDPSDPRVGDDGADNRVFLAPPVHAPLDLRVLHLRRLLLVIGGRKLQEDGVQRLRLLHHRNDALPRADLFALRDLPPDPVEVLLRRLLLRHLPLSLDALEELC